MTEVMSIALLLIGIDVSQFPISCSHVIISVSRYRFEQTEQDPSIPYEFSQHVEYLGK